MPWEAAQLFYFPEKKLTVVVLANLDTGPLEDTAVVHITQRLAEMALGASEH